MYDVLQFAGSGHNELVGSCHIELTNVFTDSEARLATAQQFAVHRVASKLLHSSSTNPQSKLFQEIRAVKISPEDRLLAIAKVEENMKAPKKRGIRPNEPECAGSPSLHLAVDSTKIYRK